MEIYLHSPKYLHGIILRHGDYIYWFSVQHLNEGSVNQIGEHRYVSQIYLKLLCVAARHVVHMGEMRNAYKILVRKPEGKRPLS
jgi:hypothetical protein